MGLLLSVAPVAMIAFLQGRDLNSTARLVVLGLTLGAALAGAGAGRAQAQVPPYDAVVVSQEVPATLTAGAWATVSVVVQNTGTQAWTWWESEDGYHVLDLLRSVGDPVWGVSEILLPAQVTVTPGHTRTFTFQVRAPATPGAYTCQWRLHHWDEAAGVETPFGAATPAVTVQVVAPPPAYAAAFLGQEVPATLVAGQTAIVKMTFRNTGTQAWTQSADGEIVDGLYSVVPGAYATWGVDGLVLRRGQTVAPGQQHTFSLTVVAPPTPGAYPWQWQLEHAAPGEATAFGPATPAVTLTVGAVPTLYDAVVVNEPVVPAVWEAGSCRTLAWTWRNTGTHAWTFGPDAQGNEVVVGQQSTDAAAPTRWGGGADLGETVAPGSEVTVTAAVRAPAAAGTYPFQWQLGRRVNDAPAVVFGAATAPRQVQVGTRYAAACEGDVCTHTLTLPAGQTATVEVALRNTGLVAWEAGAVALVAQGGGGTPARQAATAEQGDVVTLPVTVTAGSGDGEVTWRLEGPAASAVCDGAETRGAFGPTVVIRVQVPVAPVDVDGGPRVLAYYHHDAIGSVRAVTDADGDVVRRYEYEPFGRVWDGPAQAPERRQFTGQEHDAATGLDYFGARYLRAEIGRFTTIDPVTTIEENLVDPQRWNRYAYVRNNPLRYTDPTGLYIVGCDASNSDCAAAMERFENLRQQALQNGDSTVRAIARGLGNPGQKGTTVTPDFAGTLGKTDNASYDSDSDTLLFKPQISGPEGVRTIVHEGSHRLDTAIANAKPGFDEAQITRWESEIGAFDAGARVQPYVVLNGIVLRPGDRKAIEEYMRQIPAYWNTRWYPLVQRRIP